MGCLFAFFAVLFPRLALLITWIARPDLFLIPFGGVWLWPLLGILLVPFTTLMYAVLWGPGAGVAGWDWLWIALAFLLDLGGALAGGYANRERAPGMARA